MIDYFIQLDPDRDGSFAQDLTQDLLSLSWQLGFADIGESMARPGTATLLLHNRDARYSPQTANAVPGLEPGTPFRIQSQHAGTLRTHFSGFLSQISATEDEDGSLRWVLRAQSIDASFSGSRVQLQPQAEADAGLLIAEILQQLALAYAIQSGYIRVGSGRSGQKLYGPPISSQIEAGRARFTYAGDTWGAGIPAPEAIAAIASSERGRFFIDRLGQARFVNRHHQLLNLSVQASFSDDFDGLRYEYGGPIINRVRLRLRPREAGPAGSLLWRLAAPLTLRPGRDQMLIARFEDAQGRPWSATQLDQIIPGQSYSASAAPDGSGPDRTGSVQVHIQSWTGAAARIRLSCTQAATLQTLILTGTPLRQGPALWIDHTAPGSTPDYGATTLELDLPELASITDADQIARYELRRRGQPQGQPQALTIDAAHHPQAALGLSILDRIALDENQSVQHSEAFIIAEAHHVDRGGARHRVRWLLEAVEDDRFVIIGRGRLNGQYSPAL